MTETAHPLEVTPLFITPVFSREWHEAGVQNRQLEQFIRSEMEVSSGVTLSNLGGWQSNDDLLQRDAGCIGAFRNWIISSTLEIYQHFYKGRFRELLRAENINITFECTAWANVNPAGTGNKLHNHPGSHWSGVYYVRTPPDCGEIEFLDPRLGVNMVTARHRLLDIFGQNQIRVQPRSGLTVMFPSWLYHSVGDNRSSEDRISIAFNVALRKA